MKILILSDTHGHYREAIDVINTCKKELDLVLHLGDTYKDFLQIKDSFPEISFAGVVGNNDFFIKEEPNELFLNLDGVNTYICHGHQFGVKRELDTLTYRAISKEANLVLFGHTHTSEKIVNDNLILYNPGALCDGNFGIIEIRDKAICSIETLFWDRYKRRII